MKYKIWLLMLNVNDCLKIELIKKYKNECEIYKKIYKILPEFNLKQEYIKENELEKALEVSEWILNNNVGFITYFDEEYPEELKNIDNPPYGLFYKGNIKILKDRKVAIVGSRSCSQYGLEITKLLTKELISFNITIISGGAKGIDSCAHKTCVESSGKTVVVLGCGIDIIYPSVNKRLFDEVLKDGLIITEFIPGTKPLKYNFPRRNRIISGLSETIIVAEASEKSGSLITAGIAAEQNKNVMAIPGTVFSKSSLGCNKLIRDGAQIFSEMEDLRTLLNLTCENKERIISPIKQKILSIVSNEPMHIDEIVSKTFIDREAIFNVLFDMQIRKEIISLPGNYYAKII
ncbi:MAG: DNA-processing protein DprA [Clostridium sp.]|uniref:DNA-processing protein DprA n=1 Tax=Clostridium sp. DSM 8431 TaxID=1761781 RepID=UPI0008E242D6|nr:DNA-processing protein DprA [Clostridium sp. DSM 8431]MCR4943710.1 DNA-processing protein DprA [Clostridium sp.]SFU36631.1 DNA processing protein [Clostridium sp. DSM 8431]